MTIGSHMSEERMKALYESFTQGARPLEELLAGKDKLKGAEAQAVRSAFAKYSLHPADCDDFEWSSALMVAKEEVLKTRWNADVVQAGGSEGALRKWEAYRDSPNKLPVYDILQVGAFTNLSLGEGIPEKYYQVLDWMISLGISVNGTDVAGYTALDHSLSCNANVRDLRWSSILLAASGDPIAALNHKNRFGATAAHSVTLCMVRPGEEELRTEVLEWMLERGANVDVPDNDGATPRRTAARTQLLNDLIAEHDEAFQLAGGCAFCRRGGVAGSKGKGKEGSAVAEGFKMQRCARCHSRSYCSQACQKLDWPAHKANSCTPPT